MRQTLTTFILGVIVGVGIVVGTGYAAGFQRPAPVLPQAAAAQPKQSAGWEDYAAVERNIPKDLQECVGRLQMTIYQRELKFALEKALGTCLAMQKPPRSVAQK